MKTRHCISAAVGLVLLLLAIWQITAAAQGLQITPLRMTTPPMTLVRPAEATQNSPPLVLIGHGFAGSSVIMRGFAFTLAYAGYDVVLWDFDGHGTNAQPLSANSQEALKANAEAALAEALRRGVGDAHRLAILGHSMGSAVALSFGQEHPQTAATIAVSPVERPVTPELPRNLLLLAGSLEAPFVRHAEQRLAEAGGAGGDAAAGTARALLVVPGVEHISILFSPTAHSAARDWLDETFGPQPGARAYTDRRVRWYGLGLLGILLLSAALAPLIGDCAPDRAPDRPLWWRLASLAGGALGASLLLWAASQAANFGLRNLLGLLVGGYIMIWFGVAGSLSLLLLWRRPSPLAGRTFLGAAMTFAALWLGVGLLGQPVWLPWLLIPRRLLLWPLGALLTLPWFLAVGEAARGAGRAGRVGWWLAHTALLVGGFLLASTLSPELGFIVLIIPLFPIILGLHALAVEPYRGSWAYALSGALFTSWLFLAVFPLQ